jgi:Domain of unknown function DUF29
MPREPLPDVLHLWDFTWTRRGDVWEGPPTSDHIAEEIEGVGHRQCHAVTRHLRVLMLYLLQWEYQPERRVKRWLRRIDQAQAELESYLWESPSLQAQLPTLVARAYLQACRLAARETGLPAATFPVTCPWPPEHLVDTEVLPDELGRDADGHHSDRGG